MKLDRTTLTPDKAAMAALMNFAFELRGVRTLLDLYDDATDDILARRDPNLEVLKRAGIILTVTAWETLIETILTAQFETRVANASTPDDIKSTFNHVAQAWLDSTKPKPPDLAQWTGTSWKTLILDRFRRDIAELNTPSSANIRRLFKKYLEVDIISSWKWQRVSSTVACQKLDRLIELRGDLVHRGKDYIFENKAKALRRQLVEAMNLVTHLAERTAAALKIPLPDEVLWRMHEK
jgi:hypothetical protein